jgi:hypothetical protein
MTEFYVYIHTRNDTNAVFYVGKGRGNRHVQRNDRNSWWQNIVNKHGRTATILDTFEAEADAFAMERYLIASYKALGLCLCNQTDGGDGQSGYLHTEETKIVISKKMRILKLGKLRPPGVIEKMAVANRTRVRSPEEIEKRSIAMRGNTNGKALKGRPKSEETKAKMKASWFRTPEARERTRLGSLGKTYSAERIAKIQATRAGYKPSEATKEKTRQTMLKTNAHKRAIRMGLPVDAVDGSLTLQALQ